MTSGAPLLELRHISKSFAPPSTWLGSILPRDTARPVPPPLAVDNVSLTLAAGEIVGLVGESGSGKSTLARVIMGLYHPEHGERLWQGKTLTPGSQPLELQMIFQDAAAALNPRQTIGDVLQEAPLFHRMIGHDAASAHVEQLLQRVGLKPEIATRYPHQLSGGQRTRVGIARALSVHPHLLVCDEAVASLDLSTQAQILDLLLHLREQAGLAILFISHDLSVIRRLCDRTLVMYRGRIVESGPTPSIFSSPQDSYTQQLLAAIPFIPDEWLRAES